MANSPFPGFPDEAIRFFKALARNNRREWFQPRKPVFDEQVKKPIVELCEALNVALKRFAPAYVTDPAKAVYRIYRDTRFSNDKTPYKDHIAASFRHKSLGGDDRGAGFYFQVSHKDVAVGGGIYMPSPETLLAVRHHLAEHHEALDQILKSRALTRLLGDLQGDQLSRAPKGFPTDHPAAAHLRRKQIYFFKELPADLATTPAVYKEIVTRFEAMAPFLEFLNAPLKASNQQSAFSNQPRAEGAQPGRRRRPS